MNASPLNTTVDMTGLNEKLGNLLGALIGTGQKGDIHTFLRTEAGQLAWDISNAVGPTNAESARDGVSKSMAYVFRTEPSSNLDRDQRYSSTADFTWIYSWSKNGGGVIGVNDEDNQTRAGAGELETMLRAGLKHKRGKAYIDLGKRGKMHIMRLNRIMISKSGWNGLAKKIMDSTGQLRASFAATAERCGIKKRIPAFVRRHITGGMSKKSIFDDSAMNHPTNPSITFGSTAKGVFSNPYVEGKIAKAVANRKHILIKKMNQIIAGHTYNWNTGQVFKKQVPEGGLPD